MPSAGTAAERFEQGKRCLDDAVALLPTPRALDSTGVRGRTQNRTEEANARAGLTLTDVLIGDSTNSQSADGSTSSDGQRLHRPSLTARAASGSRRRSSSG